LIDSANHSPQADSSIEYDPLQKCFDLKIGPKCLDMNSSPPQLYISYGNKGDAELLLNFGFLPGVNVENDASTREEQRKRLADAFLQRNTS